VKAEVELRVIAGVLGTDRGESLIGIPALVSPGLGLPVPELALYEVVRAPRRWKPMRSIRAAAPGSARQGRSWVAPIATTTPLLFISLTRTDADFQTMPSADLQAGL
jgi:hypothetical protein